MGRITMKELREIMEMLEKAGLNPQICDTPVPYYDASVQAGIPTDPGDVSYEGMEWMPSELVNTSMMIIKVRGESMRDAGFCSGDRVLVDRDVLCLNDYETFVQWVNEDVPDHEHLPDVQDLPRVSYASFSKPVSKWDADDAPVKGKRFRDYCEIARIMDEEL